MKKLTFITITIVMFSFAVSTFAQTNVATATATATILTPITIVKNTDMSFGNIMGVVAGTVTLATTGAPTYSAGLSGSAVPAATAAITAADFTVTGTPAAAYSITLTNASITLTNAAANTMTVNNFVTNPTPTGTLGSPVGTQTLLVGATLNIGAAQAAGTYTNATDLEVTVNYN